MNNYHFIAIQKAASWKHDTVMQARCVAEFHAIKANETIDTKELAISSAKHVGIAPSIVALFEVAPTTTSGHVDTNGGLRGHSCGDIFPWRVMLQGRIDSLNYWVINPQGEKVRRLFTSKAAFTIAAILKAESAMGAA